MAGLDLARVVTVTALRVDRDRVAAGPASARTGHATHHVVAYDFGVKRNILRMLASRGCRVTVVPAQTPAAEVHRLRPDGLFLSNGPGDPEPCDYAIAAARELIDSGLPTFGICLGHQIMALASGAGPSR
jgi:carbamoyl-phosphate synthase small subunit